MTEQQRTELFAIREIIKKYLFKIKDDPKEINSSVFVIENWMPGVYTVEDIRKYEEVPYKCVQSHDSTTSPDWTPLNLPALWMQYHGTSAETARNWIQPTGAQDMYKLGEWMIFDSILYECLIDTTYSPIDYPAAWAKHE